MSTEHALAVVADPASAWADVASAASVLAAEVRRQAAVIERVRTLTDELAEYVAIRVRRALDEDE